MTGKKEWEAWGRRGFAFGREASRVLPIAVKSARRRPPRGAFRCPCCFGTRFEVNQILWKELIEAWELHPREVAYLDRQQGFRCASCKSNLRSMALAHAVLRRLHIAVAFAALPLRRPFLRVLEVNPAGELTKFLRVLPRHVLAEFPTIDVHQLPYPDGRFDVVLHSDTLEHVDDPRRAIAECLRVTRPGGFLAFTVPVVHGRLTRSRAGLTPSFHGYEGTATGDLRVETEFGADLWADVLAAGAASCAFVALEFPAGVALVAEPPERTRR